MGSLEWEGNNIYTNEEYVYLKSKLVEKGCLPEVLVNYFKYVRSLEFEEKPNYELFMDYFKREIEEIDK